MTNILEVIGLNKHFGGLHATRDVSMQIPKGELHAIIGPNGAGKTTLISQLFGELRPSAGTVHLNGNDVTRAKVNQRSRLGMSRSFQITNLVRDMTVRENVMLALLAGEGHAHRFWRRFDRNHGLRAQAEAALQRAGVKDDFDRPVSELSHGEQRVLELAIALVGDPMLLLLDEPMAGLGPEESKQMTRFLSSIKGTVAILLVEHDMDAVFELADRITVLVRGQIVAVGNPDEIRADPRVKEAYLGEDA